MTKEELIEAMKDMPDDAEIRLHPCRRCGYSMTIFGVEFDAVEFNTQENKIFLY